MLEGFVPFQFEREYEFCAIFLYLHEIFDIMESMQLSNICTETLKFSNAKILA